jgi:hypothetical protein
MNIILPTVHRSYRWFIPLRLSNENCVRIINFPFSVQRLNHFLISFDTKRYLQLAQHHLITFELGDAPRNLTAKCSFIRIYNRIAFPTTGTDKNKRYSINVQLQAVG